MQKKPVIRLINNVLKIFGFLISATWIYVWIFRSEFITQTRVDFGYFYIAYEFTTPVIASYLLLFAIRKMAAIFASYDIVLLLAISLVAAPLVRRFYPRVNEVIPSLLLLTKEQKCIDEIDGFCVLAAHTWDNNDCCTFHDFLILNRTADDNYLKIAKSNYQPGILLDEKIHIIDNVYFVEIGEH